MLQVNHVLCFHSLYSTVTLILSPHLSEFQILHFSLEDVMKNCHVQGVSVADPMFHLWFLYKIIANVLVGFSVCNWCFIGPYCVKTLKTLKRRRYNWPALSMRCNWPLFHITPLSASALSFTYSAENVHVSLCVHVWVFVCIQPVPDIKP